MNNDFLADVFISGTFAIALALFSAPGWAIFGLSVFLYLMLANS